MIRREQGRGSGPVPLPPSLRRFTGSGRESRGVVGRFPGLNEGSTMLSPKTIAGIQVSPDAPITAECQVCHLVGTKAVATIEGPTLYLPSMTMCDPCAAAYLTTPSAAVRIVTYCADEA